MHAVNYGSHWCNSIVRNFLCFIEAGSGGSCKGCVSLLQGDRVKLTLTFKGREMQFLDIGKDLFKVRSL